MKPKYINDTTPFSTLRFLNIVTPDEKYGKYGLLIVLSKDDKEQKAFSDKWATKSKEDFEAFLLTQPKGVRKRYRMREFPRGELDKEYNPTGNTCIRVRTNRPTRVVDAEGKTMENEEIERLWSGTIGRCQIAMKFSVDTSDKIAGYVAYLNATQVLKPIYGGAYTFDPVPADKKDGGDSSEIPF